MKWLSKLQYIALYLLSLLIIGAASILTGDIGIDILKEPSYYIEQIVTYAAIICVTFATLYNYIDNFKSTNEEFLSNEKYISEFATGKENVPSIFQRFLDPFNRKRKIKQFKYDIRMKLYALENKRKYKILGPRVYDEYDYYIWNHGTEEEKSKNAYCLRRKQLELQLTDEYIETHIDIMVLTYDRVTANVILGGYFQDSDKFSPNEFITKNPNKKVLKYKLPQLLYSFAITFLMSSLVFDSFKFDFTSIINLITKILILIWNCYTTIRYASTFTKTVTLKDSRFRKGVIVEYRKWLQQEAAKKDSENKEVNSDDTGRNLQTDIE